MTERNHARADRQQQWKRQKHESRPKNVRETKLNARRRRGETYRKHERRHFGGGSARIDVGRRFGAEQTINHAERQKEREREQNMQERGRVERQRGRVQYA